MCGIIGSFSAQSQDVINKRLLNGINQMLHRGPDDSGRSIIPIGEKILGFGHTRLSIIDLSPAGHQPMMSKDKRYTIVYNGEIYNYKELRQELETEGYSFDSDSDTEVLIASWSHWGENCLHRFKGMFAFAILDHEKLSLTCVRDAFGIKPLFYSYNDGEFSFASEVGALITLIDKKSAPNFQMIYDYLVFGGYDNQQNTFYENINHLLPGHFIEIELENLDKVLQKRWWSPSIVERKDLTFEDAAERLRQMFLENVRIHLRSDVPIGAALSGGLDSSSVVCAMRYLEPDMPIHTFSYVAKNSSMDEEHWADIVNDEIKAIPHKIYVDSGDLSEDIDDMILSQGEPFVGTSIYAQYKVFKAAKENGIVVTLDGQGADEVLAGYNGFPEARFKSFVESKEVFAGIRFLRNWLAWPGRNKSEAIKAFIKPFLPSFLHRLINQQNIKAIVPNWVKTKKVGQLGLATKNIASDPTYLDDIVKGREVVRSLRAALTGNGLNSLLRHADRNAMRWSIESRVPFLTIEMADFLLSLPESYLISNSGETKSIFRAAMRGIVPDSILDRRDKVGFATPELTLLQSQKDRVYNWVLPAKDLSFIDYDLFLEELQDTLSGKVVYHPRIWRMINVCRWLERNQWK